MTEHADVPSALRGLLSRVSQLEGAHTEISAPDPTPAANPDGEEFFRMDNPLMWGLIVGGFAIVFGIWWVMNRKVVGEGVDGIDDDDHGGDVDTGRWPRQTTPHSEYARHYGVPERT